MVLAAHTFNPTILREYDIRGVIGQTLSERDARGLGGAFATFVRHKEKTQRPKICVGFDGRLSSPSLEAALVDGLVQASAQVTRIGLGPTPMLYFAVKHEQADGGIMITGSHNPPDYNGFKMVTKSGPIYGVMVQEIGKIAASGAFVQDKGAAAQKDVRDAYLERLLKDYDGVEPMRVVWDAGNGAAGEIMRRLCEKLPGRHTLLFDKIDGTFPNHHPDPSVEENLAQLRAEVIKNKAQLGIAFDGDGDRIGALDEEGRVVAGDQLLAFFAQDLLKKKPGATIIGDVKVSQTVFDAIASAGGKPLMWKTGHSLLKAKMMETGALLVGEMSGHIVFAEQGFDDALYAAVRLMGLVSRTGSLAYLRDSLPPVFNTPEIRIPSTEARKFAVVEEIKTRLEKSGVQINAIDGVRVKSGDGWWLLRASNTQNVLVGRAESFTAEGLEKLKDEMKKQLQESGIKI
ncbi:MAG: phosphomannomutase/phosphoglucomutase [Proteobacteria bacterium]|nr:phosphomannomutase/phosphoglucomutase [Pseudomonadota bacterium]